MSEGADKQFQSKQLNDLLSLANMFVDQEKKIDVLRKALQEAVDVYGKPGGPWNIPSDPGGWLGRARKALKA